MQQEDIKDTVQYCLSEDADFVKIFGTNFSLQPMGSTTAGFTRGGKDFFTTFGSYQVVVDNGKKQQQQQQQRAIISLVATHDGLQSLELHMGGGEGEDQQRDIAILSLPKPASQQQQQPGTADKYPSTTNKESYQDDINSQATPATVLDTATACDIDDDDDDSDSDDTSSLQEARGRLGQPKQRGVQQPQRPPQRPSRASVRNEKIEPSQVSLRGKNRAIATAPSSIPLEIKTESTHQQELPTVSKIPLEIDTVSLGKNDQSHMPNCSKPLDDTYNSDEDDDEDEEDDEHDVVDQNNNNSDDDDDDDSSNPFADSDDDSDIADDDADSSDDDSDARDVRCQQQRGMSAGYGGAFHQ